MAALKKPSQAAPQKTAPAKPAAPKAAAAKPVAAKTATRPAAKKAAAPSDRPAAPRWSAPSDFKPAFFDFRFETDEYGLIKSGTLSGVRVRGRWDNEEAKRYDMSEYDQATLTAFGMRVSTGIFAPNPEKRIPANTAFRLIVRVSKRAADESLAARFVGMSHSKIGGKKEIWFADKTDITYRKLRKCARVLPSAFVNVQLPPSRRRSSADEE